MNTRRLDVNTYTNLWQRRNKKLAFHAREFLMQRFQQKDMYTFVKLHFVFHRCEGESSHKQSSTPQPKIDLLPIQNEYDCSKVMAIAETAYQNVRTTYA